MQECTLWFGVSAFASLYLTLLLIMSGPKETCTMRLLKVKESHVHAIPTHFVSRPAMRNFTRRISHRYTCKQGHTEACVLTPGEALDALLWHVVPHKLARALSLSLSSSLSLSPPRSPVWDAEIPAPCTFPPHLLFRALNMLHVRCRTSHTAMRQKR